MTPRERVRAALTAGLLTPACTECPATAGEWCDPSWPPPSELVRWDQDPPHVIHSARLVTAVESGHASRPRTIAQFAGGPLPSGLTPEPR